MIKKSFVLLLLILTILSTDAYCAVNKQKVFNNLDKKEQLSVLRSMRRQEISQINSQIKDVKSSIKSVENSSDIPLNISQAKLLKLNQELTELTKKKSDLEQMYALKINSVKKK